MASKAIHPIIQRLIDLIEPTEDGHQAGPTSAFGHARNKGTNPHGGFDINRGKDVPGSVASPVYGRIGTVVKRGLGTIVIHEVDPVTKQPTGYDIEILHTQAQNLNPGDPVTPGQPIGVQGGTGVDGVGKPHGASHAHIQVYKGNDPTPLNPLRHLYEYHYPGQPILPLPELEPYSVLPRHAARANPDSEHDPVLAPSSQDAPPDGPGPAAPNTRPPTLPPSQFSPPPPAPKPPSSIGPPLDLTPHGLPPASGDGFEPRSDPTGSLYFNPPSSPRQFGPFTLPGANNSPTDNDNPGNSFTPAYSTPGQFGNDGGSAPGAAPQSINGNAADRTGVNDIGGEWPRQNLPNWAHMQPLTENTFPASNGVRGMAGGQPPAPENGAPQPALTVQNLTTHMLRMKGVPEADIGAAINDPAKMQNLLNQYYGRRSTIAPGDGNDGLGNQFGQATSVGQPGQASTPAAAPPNDYIPFGWSGLPPLLR